MIQAPATQMPVTEMMGEVVAAVNAKLLPYLKTINPNIRGIRYEHGLPDQLVETLIEMGGTDKTEAEKTPLIALIEDINEERGEAIGYYGILPLRILVTMLTEEEWKSATRYTERFNTIITPIYEELLNQMFLYPHFAIQSPSRIKHTKTNHPFGGLVELYGSQSSQANDPMDCIESRLNITVRHYKREILPFTNLKHH